MESFPVGVRLPVSMDKAHKATLLLLQTVAHRKSKIMVGSETGHRDCDTGGSNRSKNQRRGRTPQTNAKKEAQEGEYVQMSKATVNYHSLDF